MVYAQQEAERHANKKRDPAPEYCAGDKVWLFLQNVHTMRPCQKLDWKHAKYTIQETIDTHAIQLDMSVGIHNVFHVDLIHSAGNDSLPSQRTDDTQSSLIQVDDEDEYQVEKVVSEHHMRRGRGWQKSYLI